MIRSLSLALLGTLAVASSPVLAAAPTAPNAPLGQPTPLLPQVTPLSAPTPDGRIGLLHGVLSAPLTGDLSEAARQFALARRTELGLPADSTFGPPKALGTRFGGSVHLNQQVGGVDVDGASVVVTLDQFRRVIRLASSVNAYQRALMSWAMSPEQAMLLAAREIDGAALQSNGQPTGGYAQRAFSVGSEVHAGYLVWVPTTKISENWHVAIDATNGAVLWSQNRVHHASNDGAVYAINPGGLDAGVGVTPTVVEPLQHLSPDAGFTLTGTRLTAYGCCPTLGCAPDAGPRRATGQFQTQQGVVNYDFAICDRLQRASSDPEVHASGDFVYAPVDPPTTASPQITSPADYDEFAEVQGYYHANKVYDLMETLSTGGNLFSPFTLRDNRQGKQAAVWVNASEPNLGAAMQTAGGYVSNSLSRVENAMFLPRENMVVVSVPEYAFNSDALVIYQGDNADFAYDSPVLWHEFGHGIIYSTSDWSTQVTIDARSANNESSALHEGNADVIAFMVDNLSAIGTYVAPRSASNTGNLRDANNTFKCPDVLWGESHQDSMHYSAAIWEARTGIFAGTDNGRTFDAAFYAALVSFPKDVNFEKAAAIIVSAVGLAFPNVEDAEGKMRAIFEARGVAKCSKVLDVTDLTAPREYYGVPGTVFAAMANNTVVPGPYQLKFHVPLGAKSVSVEYQGFGGGGMTVTQRVLAKANAPITFTRVGTTGLSNDADATGDITTVSQGVRKGTAMIDVPCGGDVYFTVGNSSQRDRTIFNLKFSYEKADSCPPPVDEVPDAGMQEPAADITLTPIPSPLGAANAGCGCTNAAAVPGLLFAAALWLRRRRR